MNKNYTECAKQMKEIAALGSASGVLGWDEETMMPKKAVTARAEQSAAISGVIHEKLVDPKLGSKLKELKANPEGLTKDQRICVREWLRDFEKYAKIPPDLVREIARVTTHAHEAWVKARKKSDFATFAPWLDKVFDLKRREAKAMGYEDNIYDALLDEYEPHMTVASLDPMIDELRDGLVPIVRAISQSKARIDASFIGRRYPEEKQEAICREIKDKLGVDPDASRLDRSVHPFCCGIAPTDVRITTRFDEKLFTQSLYGVIHESGHAMYEQGLDTKHLYTPLAESASTGVHESQSRLWENMICRSHDFTKFLLPLLKKRFGTQLKGVGADKFYRAINGVRPTFIRVEADEVTYNLHIIIRYELEKKLLAKKMSVKELPEVWNDMMEEYLGIKPKDDAQGVLQDTHWSNGMIGYFPTYLIGNLYSAQIWNALSKEIRGVGGRIAKGDFKAIHAWLKKRIYHEGRRYKPAELIEKATGKKPSAKYFLDYLKKKYSGIYGINL